MYRSILALVFSSVFFAALPAYANMPIFSADCPQGNYIDVDRTGTVRVNGAVASVEKFNEQYYEVRQGGIAYSISHNGDGSGLQVGYNPPGSAGGYCTIRSSAQAPSRGPDNNAMIASCRSYAARTLNADAGRINVSVETPRVDGTIPVNGEVEGMGTRFQCTFNPSGTQIVEWRTDGSASAGSSNMVQVTGVPNNDVLNVRQRPTPKAPIVGALSNGTTVRNLGCETLGPSTWCQIQFLDDMGGGGWVNARYLNMGGVATQLPQTAPSMPSGTGETRTVQVRFPSGMSGTELRDNLAPGASIRYVLNARSGQNLYVRVSGDGMSYQIFNPDNSFLLDQVSASNDYRGELWQSGNHVIEVINRNNQSRLFSVTISIN